MTAWSVAPLSMSVMKQQKYSPKHGPISFFPAQSFPTFFLSFKKKMFNASPGSRKNTFHSLSRGLRPNQGHLQVSPAGEREVWKRAWKLILDQNSWATWPLSSFPQLQRRLFLWHFFLITQRRSRWERAPMAVTPTQPSYQPLVLESQTPGLSTRFFSRWKAGKKKTCLQRKETHQS